MIGLIEFTKCCKILASALEIGDKEITKSLGQLSSDCACEAGNDVESACLIVYLISRAVYCVFYIVYFILYHRSTVHFYSAPEHSFASAVYATANPSVRLSLLLSLHFGIRSKGKNAEGCGFHRRVAQYL